MLKQYFYNLANDKKGGLSAVLVKSILLLFSLVYSLLIRIISFAYRANILKIHHLNCKVISIGNITWGGTGKTPIVEMVARRLAKEGHRVVIQSRGYKKKSVGGSEPKIQYSDSMGDEAFMLQQNLIGIPVAVGGDRLKSARLAVDKMALDTIILDDGFQHWKIFRDIDIVVIDAMNPFGNGCLIPRGILREPFSALKRADIFLLTHTDLAEGNLTSIKQRLKDINKEAIIMESVHAPIGFYNILDEQKKLIDANLLKNRKLALITAIGNPDSFEKTLLNLGLRIYPKFIFLDHHDFLENDFEKITQACLKEGVSTILTTQKDAAKLEEYAWRNKDFDIFALRIEIKIKENENLFFDRLLSIYKC